MDDRRVYHIHSFGQNNDIKAVSVVRTLVRKTNTPTALSDIMHDVGGTEKINSSTMGIKTF